MGVVLIHNLDGELFSGNYLSAYLHMGISLLGESIFALDRGVVTAVARETESRLYGKYPKEELVLKEKPGKCKVTVQVKIDGPSKESIIDVFELKSIP